MTITISNTSKIVEINGVPARIWEGTTESGITVHCFITRIAALNVDNQEEFLNELQQVKAPSADVSAYFYNLFID